MSKPKNDNKQSNQGTRLIDKPNASTPKPDSKREQATKNDSEKR